MKKIFILLLIFILIPLLSCKENDDNLMVINNIVENNDEYVYSYKSSKANYNINAEYKSFINICFNIGVQKRTYGIDEVITINFEWSNDSYSNYRIKNANVSILDDEYFEVLDDEKHLSNFKYEFKIKIKKLSYNLIKFNFRVSFKLDEDISVFPNYYEDFTRDNSEYSYLCPIYFISDELGTYFAGIGEIVEKDNSYFGNVFHFQNRLNELYNKGIIDKEEYINRLVNNYKNSLFGYYVSPNLSFKINFTNENYDKFKYLLSLEEYLYLAYETNNLTLEEFNSELKNYQSLVYNYNYLMFYTDLLPFEITNSDLDKMAFNDSDYINGYYVINNKVVGKVNDNYKYDFTFDYNGYPFGLSEDYIWE